MWQKHFSFLTLSSSAALRRSWLFTNMLTCSSNSWASYCETGLSLRPSSLSFQSSEVRHPARLFSGKYWPLDPGSVQSCDFSFINPSSRLGVSTLGGARGKRCGLENWVSGGDTVGSPATFSPSLMLCRGNFAWLTWDNRWGCVGEGSSDWGEPSRGIKDACLGFEFLVLTDCSSVCCELLLDRDLVVTQQLSPSWDWDLGLVPGLGSSVVLIWFKMLDWRLLWARPNVALTSWRVILAWWALPDFKNTLFTDKSSNSSLSSIKESFLLVPLWFSLESRELEVSLVEERVCATFFAFVTFILEELLGLVSEDKKAGWALSFTNSVSGLVLVCVWGSATKGAEPEGRSCVAGTCLDFAASIKARRLFFLGVEAAGGRDGDCDWAETGGMVAVLICLDSCCFFFLVAGGGDSELRDNEGGVPALCEGVCGDDDTAGFFLLFFAATDTTCMDAAPSGDDDVWFTVTSCLVGGVLELAAALQCGRWVFSLL